MPDVGVLKEYLVKVGFKDDINEYNQVKSKVNSLGSFIKDKLQLPGSLYTAGGAFLGFLSSVNTYAAVMAHQVAEADKDVERLARRLWTSKENAYALQNALDAMGKSYEDIFYMTPEEFRQFKELKSLASDIKPPAELEGTLQKVRAIYQEVNKLKMIFGQARQWVVYYLGRMMGGDLDKILQKFRSLTEYIVKNLPQITEKIASFFYKAYRLGKAGIELIVNITSGIKNFVESLDTGAKQALAVLTWLFAVLTLKAGPVIAMFTAVYALFLLLDDFFTYKRGGKSYYAEQWEALTKAFSGKEGSIFSRLTDDAKDLLSSVANLGVKIAELASKLHLVEVGEGIFQALLNMVDTTLIVITKTIDAIITLISWIEKAGEGWGLFFKWLSGGDEGLDNKLQGVMQGNALPFGFATTGAESQYDATQSYLKNVDSHNVVNATQSNVINVQSISDIPDAIDAIGNTLFGRIATNREQLTLIQ